VTLTDLAENGVSAAQVLSHIAQSLWLAEDGESVDLAALAERFQPDALPKEPWILTDADWR
jgi:glutamyl-tRNA synthetase